MSLKLLQRLDLSTDELRRMYSHVLATVNPALQLLVDAAFFDEESWHYVGDSGEPVFQNSWANYDATEATDAQVKFYRDAAGAVVLEGLGESGTIATGTTGTIFTLPPSYRPAKNLFFPVRASAAGTLCAAVLYVDSSGNVRAHSKDVAGALDYFSLSGVRFRADDYAAASLLGA